MSDSVWPHRRQPTRLSRPWDSPGKNPGVGCHFLLQCMKVKSESEVAQSCPTLSDPLGCSLPGFFIHGTSPGKSTEMGCHCLLWNIVLVPIILNLLYLPNTFDSLTFFKASIFIHMTFLMYITVKVLYYAAVCLHIILIIREKTRTDDLLWPGFLISYKGELYVGKFFSSHFFLKINTIFLKYEAKYHLKIVQACWKNLLFSQPHHTVFHIIAPLFANNYALLKEEKKQTGD